VICYRNPLAVGQSLKRRNQLPLDQAIDLWTQYTACGIASTAGERRVFVGYEDLFRQRAASIARLASFMDMSELGVDEQFRLAVDHWLDDELHHHQRQLRDLVSHPAVSPEARDLFLMLELVSHSAAMLNGASAEDVRELVDALDVLAQQVVDRQGLPR
jgi:hypothetical protein